MGKDETGRCRRNGRRRWTGWSRINLTETDANRSSLGQSLHMSTQSIKYVISCFDCVWFFHKVDKSASLTVSDRPTLRVPRLTFSGNMRTLSMAPYGENTCSKASLVALTSRLPIHRLLVGIWGVEVPATSGVPAREVCDEADILGPRLMELSRDRFRSRSERERGG